MFLDIGAIFEAIAQNHVHKAESEREIGPGVDDEMLIGHPGGTGFDGIDHDEAGAAAAGVDDERPQVDVISVNIGAPGDDEFGFPELFRLGAEAVTEGGHQGRAAGGGTNSAIKTRGAEAVEEAAVHAGVIQQAHGAGVAVGQHGFRTEFAHGGRKAGGDGVYRLIPTDARELAGTLGSGPFLRVKKAIGGVFAFQILGDFSAQKALRYRVIGVAAQPGADAIFHVDEQPAGVRTIQ